MKVNRVIETETNCFKIGDQINVSHYTATCQTVTPNVALFLLDQYLDKAFPMNGDDTNKGGYAFFVREGREDKRAIDVAVNILGERYGYPDDAPQDNENPDDDRIDEDNTGEDWP